MFGSCVQSTWGLPTSPKHWNVSQQHPVVQKLMYVHQQHCVFFPEVAQMGLYDDACYPLAVLHWKKCDCRKNMETPTCDKKNEGCRQQSYDKNQQRNGAQSWDFNQYPYRDAATKQKHKSNYINY